MHTVIRSSWALGDPLLTEYYDTEWGIPVTDEQGVFERLSLEAFQAGLSWLTVLRKRAALRVAFAGFDPDRVAKFDTDRIERMMTDPALIRNRRKIEATVSNAAATIRLRDHFDGGLAALVWSYMPERSPAPTRDDEVPATSPESHALARELKRYGFRFVGPTTAYALMSAIGIVDLHVVESHRRGCSGLWRRDGTRTGRSPSVR